MKWTRIAFFVLTIALVALTAVFYWRAPPPEAAPTLVHVAAPSASAVHGADVIAALLPKRQPSLTKIYSAPFSGAHLIYQAPGDLAKEATPDALAGLPDAMHVLAMALRECTRADMGSDDDIEKKVAKRSLGREILKGDSANSNPAQDAAEVKRLEGIRDSCRQIPSSESNQWLNWLEKSAAAGDSQARAAYAWLALQEFQTQEAKEENAEEYVRRRDAAFAMLQDSIANGDCSNGLLNGFRQVSPDPLNHYVYEGLLLQHALDDFSTGRFAPDYVNRESQSVTAFLNNLADAVPLEQRGSAQATIRDILQNYCTQF